MNRKAKIYYRSDEAGLLEQTEHGYRFTYHKIYLEGRNPKPVSLTLPLSSNSYHSAILFPFFDGLIPEGWLLLLAGQYWHLRITDRYELLLALCNDTIGAVTVIPIDERNMEEE